MRTPHLARLGLLVCSALFTACAGSPTPATIDGEPVCADFEIGATHTKMMGGLKQPVTVLVKDDEDVVFRWVIRGRRSETDTRTHTVLPDDDNEYTVEWYQCENERAPAPADGAGANRHTPTYECGTLKEPYATANLVTKKGDPQSHTITFAPPPNPACWQGEAPPAAVSAPPPVVEPPPPVEPTPSASAASSASAAPAASSAAPEKAKPTPAKGPKAKGDGAAAPAEGATIQE